jgi:hypothetical protein
MKMGTLRNSAAGGGLKHPRFFYYQKIVKYNHFHASKRPNIFNVRQQPRLGLSVNSWAEFLGTLLKRLL